MYRLDTVERETRLRILEVSPIEPKDFPAHAPAIQTSKSTRYMSRVEFFNSVRESPASHWEDCDVQHFFASRDWFLLQEQLREQNFGVVAIVEDGKAKAVTPYSLGGWRSGSGNDPTSWLAEMVQLPIRAEEVTVVGGWNGGLTKLTHCDSAELALKKAITEIKDRTGSPYLVIQYLDSTQTETILDLFPASLALLSQPTCALTTSFKDFEEYLKLFSTRQRKKIRSEQSRFGLDTRISVEYLADVIDQVAPLVASRGSRFGAAHNLAESRHLLETQISVLGGKMRCFCAWRNGKLTAVTNTIEDVNQLYARSFGQADEIDSISRNFDYFNVGYYEPIKYSIKKGIHTLWVGPHAFEAKVRRGMSLIPTWSVLIASDWPDLDSKSRCQAINDTSRIYWSNWLNRTTGTELGGDWYIPQLSTTP